MAERITSMTARSLPLILVVALLWTPVFVTPSQAANFTRGDVTASGGDPDISDAIAIVNFLFSASFAMSCLDAADVDDSGSVDIVDPLRLLFYRFLGNVVIPGPKSCGADPTVDSGDFNGELGCHSFPPCTTLTTCHNETDEEQRLQCLSELFATPTDKEIQMVLDDWSSRDTASHDWQVEAASQFSGLRFEVVSHRVAGSRHYGVVRYPARYNAQGSYPVLVENHGGNNGVGVNILGRYSGLNGSATCYQNCFIVVPSYRGEELRGAPGLGTLLSEGEPDTIDLDVDDVMSLISAVLENIPGADEDRIIASGGSRGGGVTYLLAARDPRVSTAIVLFGASDHLHSTILQDAESIAANGGPARNPVLNTSYVYGVEPYLDRKLTFQEARLALIRRSVVYFLERVAPLQVHHGERDSAVDVLHGQAVADGLARLGRGSPDYEFYFYAQGTHNPASMSGFQARVDSRLCPLLE
jgi:pimeloyl-ACP methyl ester carboxylesterase